MKYLTLEEIHKEETEILKKFISIIYVEELY